MTSECKINLTELPPAQQRVVETVLQLIKKAELTDTTGEGIIRINFNQGGPTSSKAGLIEWAK